MRKWPPNDYRLGKDFRFYCFWQLKTGRKILIFELTSWTMIDWYDQKATFSNQLENHSTKIIQLGSSTGSIFHLVGNFMLGPVGTILSHRYSLNSSAVRCWSKPKVMVRDPREPISGTHPSETSPAFPLIFKIYVPGSRPLPILSKNVVSGSCSVRDNPCYHSHRSLVMITFYMNRSSWNFEMQITW